LQRRYMYQMSRLFIVGLFFVSFNVASHLVRHISLGELVERSDHVVTVYVQEVKFVDRDGAVVMSPEAVTGSDRKNTVTLSLRVLRNGVLKTELHSFPKYFEFGLYYTSPNKLDYWKDKYLKKKFVIHLKGNPFEPTHLAGFIRPLADKKKVMKILKQKSNKKPNGTGTSDAHSARPLARR